MPNNPNITIGQKQIGQDQPAFIIAELSGNHHQKYEEAVALVKAAAAVGADAIKLQTYTPDTLTIKSDRPWFRVGGKSQPGNWQGRTLYDLYAEAHTPWDWQPKLKTLAEDLGLVFFSTPFDETAVNFLETLAVPCYKIASYEAIHLPLLAKIAQTKKPVIMSVGFADEQEITEAVDTLRKNGATEIALLHCLTAYSGAPDLQQSNLRTVEELARRYQVIAGLSDNNAGIAIPIVAAATAGAAIIEKHLILDRKLEGPDARFSLTPDEFKEMVTTIRTYKRGDREIINQYATPAEIKIMFGSIHYGPASEQEKENMFFRPSIWVKKNIMTGEVLTPENIRIARPNSGLEPKHWLEVLGKKSARKIEAATPLSWDLLT